MAIITRTCGVCIGPVFREERYVRGLDGYVFFEVYIVRCEHAGDLVRVTLPYLSESDKPGVAKVFDDPILPRPSRHHCLNRRIDEISVGAAKPPVQSSRYSLVMIVSQS